MGKECLSIAELFTMGMCFHYDKTGPAGHSHTPVEARAQSPPHYLFVQISQAAGNRPQQVLESSGRSSWPDHLWIIVRQKCLQ